MSRIILFIVFELRGEYNTEHYPQYMLGSNYSVVELQTETMWSRYDFVQELFLQSLIQDPQKPL